MLGTPQKTDEPTITSEAVAMPMRAHLDGSPRLVVQRGLFFGPSPLAPEDVYATVKRGVARRERDVVRLAPGTKVETNTYFGRFYATYWQRWTTVDSVEVTLTAGGRGLVRLMASDTNKVWRIVDAAQVEGDEREVRLVGPVDRFLDGGGMWLELTSETEELTVSKVRWHVRAPRPVAPTDVVICTYNRAEECLNTLQAMAADPAALEYVGTIHVIDQGSDPLESRERFTVVSAELGKRLRYVRQPNLGGAGGFTRGIFDATAGPPSEHRDVLLMDDDVMLEPELMIRLTTFGACASTPMIVGGQMLNLLHPAHLHVSAERADPENLVNGLPIPGSLREAYLLGLDERQLPIYQERRVDTEYNDWWACLIPAAVVRAIGYPLPVFFQWDDVEFGYRARAHGFPTVALPGAGVWHGDFGWKDWDEWHRYFNLRNSLITAALHTGFSTTRIAAQVRHLLSVYLLGMHYGLSATLLQAVEDFLEGPDILRDGSVGAASEIRRIRAAYPETTVHPISEITEDFRDLQVARSAPAPSRETLTLLKRAVYQLVDRAARPTALIPAGDAHWWHVSQFKKAVVTDMGESGVRIRRRDKRLAFELAKRGVSVIRRLRAEGPAVAERYRAAVPELTRRANGARLYGVDA